MKGESFFRRNVITKKNRPAPKQYAARSNPPISITPWANCRASNCATTTRRNRARSSHCKNSITSCSITACRPFVSSAKSCSKTKRNGTRCSDFLTPLIAEIREHRCWHHSPPPQHRVSEDVVSFLNTYLK